MQTMRLFALQQAALENVASFTPNYYSNFTLGEL